MEIRRVESEEEVKAASAFRRDHALDDDPRWAGLERAGIGEAIGLVARLDGRTVGLLVSTTVHADEPPLRRELETGGLFVAPEARNRGIGSALKLHERAWAVEQGVRCIRWAFDAADSLQAYLAIRRLAAIARRFSPAPGSPDGLAEWWLGSSRVRMRLEGGRRPPDLADYLEAETPKLNPAALDERDLPLPCDSPGAPQRSLALVEIPPDIQRMEAVDGALAKAWRDQVQAVLRDAFQRGYLATDFLYLKGERLPRSYYLLSHGEALLGL